jgi:hypothetical protein
MASLTEIQNYALGVAVGAAGWLASFPRTGIIRLFVIACSPSVVGIATIYGLESSGIESQWEARLPHPSRPALEPTQLPVRWIPSRFRG